jgi:hypothetical protein
MTSDNKLSNARIAKGASRAGELPQAQGKQALSLDTMPHKTAPDQRGSDPYNTSGSFDRKKHWVRVGKR